MKCLDMCQHKMENFNILHLWSDIRIVALHFGSEILSDKTTGWYQKCLEMSDVQL